MINKELETTSIGIICLTQENKNNPWILFESGALAKDSENSIIGTFLIDLKSQDLAPPLSQFNHTTTDKESVLKLFKTINKALGDRQRPEDKLERSFNEKWPGFINKINLILESTDNKVQPKERSDKSILLEILSTTRSLEKNINKEIINKNSSRRKSLEISMLGDFNVAQSFVSELASMMESYKVDIYDHTHITDLAKNEYVALLEGQFGVSRALVEKIAKEMGLELLTYVSNNKL